MPRNPKQTVESNCPTLEQMENYSNGDLADTHRATISAHTNSCEPCQALLQEIMANADFLSSAKSAIAREHELADYDVSEIIEPQQRQHGALEQGLAQFIPGYTIVRELKRGGQGVVYVAFEQDNGRPVALKLLRDGPLADQAMHERFQREIELTARMHHANIVPLFDSGRIESYRYYTMPLIVGDPINDYVLTEQLTEAQTLMLMSKICAAVQYAHEHGILHRDLKPSNILIDSSGQPQLLDFGLACQRCFEVSEQFNQPQQFVGTLAYASPEQIERPSSLDVRSDVYSLGVLLFELIEGQLPATTQTSLRTQDSAPVAEQAAQESTSGGIAAGSDLEAVIQQAMHMNPRQRYNSVQALQEDIERLLAHHPVHARKPTLYRQARLLVRRQRTAAFVASLAFCMIVAIAFQWYGSESVASKTSKRLRQSSGTIAKLLNSDSGQWSATQLQLVQDWIERTTATARDCEQHDKLQAADLRVELGRVYNKIDAWESARDELAWSLAIYQQHGSEAHRRVAMAQHQLALSHRKLGETQQAIELFRSAFESKAALFGTSDPRAIVCLVGLGKVLGESGQRVQAQAVLKLALDLQQDQAVRDERLYLRTQALYRKQQASKTSQRLNDDRDIIYTGNVFMEQFIENVLRGCATLPDYSQTSHSQTAARSCDEV